MKTLIALLMVGLIAGVCTADNFVRQPVDDFDNATPWMKGDPNTDMTQAEVGVRPETQIVKQGKAALAFMVRVDWTPKPGQKYAKGWPMISRKFKQPQDWSRFDQVEYWLYLQTKNKLPNGRILGVGFSHGDHVNDKDWHFLMASDVTANQWQQHVIQLDQNENWHKVTGITFYIAEAWYHDKDRLNFLLDDMELARRTVPAIGSVSASPGYAGRGQDVEMALSLQGPIAGSSAEISFSDLAGKQQLTMRRNLQDKRESFDLPTENLPAGNHWLTVNLLVGGKLVDSHKQFLRTLAPHHRSYLNLVTFYTPTLDKIKPEQLRVLNDSAYAGVAIPLFGSYNADPVPSYQSLQPQIKMVRQTLKIDPWPWVSINRMIGSPPDARGHAGSHSKSIKYFQKIKILDLDNKAGALGDMLAQFRIAVRMAKQWGSPGVVLDLEAYNNYQIYNVGYVAERRGETPAQVVAEAEQVGADMAQICQEEYPQCIVWSLFSHLVNPQHFSGVKGPVYMTTGEITLGFLEYCKAHHLPTKYLAGGEGMPGYYNRNVAALQQRMTERYGLRAPFMAEYPDNFFLAGTISPYHNYKLLTSWLQKAAGKDPQLKTIADFQPMFRTLFDGYNWVWVYAASAGKTEPYKPANNKLYSGVLNAALAESVR